MGLLQQQHSRSDQLPADIWLPARSFAAVHNVPNWNDIDPRFGAAYDLFGNHKTAIKASVSRYVSTNIYTFGYQINPISWPPWRQDPLDPRRNGSPFTLPTLTPLPSAIR